MQIERFAPDDEAAVAAYADLLNAVREVDSPWDREQTPALAAGWLAHGWDGEPMVPHLARAGGEVVGFAGLETSEYDNLDLAWLSVIVHPAHRRRGHGTAILAFLEGEARERGRTSVGVDAWDLPAVHAFATRHGFVRKLASINRRQVLADIDWPALEERAAEAVLHAADYAIERWSVPTPDTQLDALAEMAAAINDAPLDDLEYEDEVFTGARMRAYEEATAGRRERMYRLVARHLPTDALAAQTVVTVSVDDPTWADQHDTSVLESHRGHRLGLLLKAEMMRWLRDDEPGLQTIDTWNAESNAHMIGVNRLLGYQIQGRQWAYQRQVGSA